MKHRLSPWRITRLAAAFILVMIGNSGCFRTDSVLTLRSDGSGTLRLTYAMTESAYHQLAQGRTIALRLQQAGHAATNVMATTPPAPDPMSFCSEEIHALLAPCTNSGLVLRKLNVLTQRDWRTVQMEIAFRRLEDLARLPIFSSIAMSLRRNRAGNYLFTLEPLQLRRHGALPDVNDATREDLTLLLAGLSIIFEVTTPGAILDATTEDRRSHTARWAFLFDQDPQVLAKIDHKPLTILFQGSGLNLPEFNKPAAP